jgi:nucleotide-binding universal stress UspA family protein
VGSRSIADNEVNPGAQARRDAKQVLEASVQVLRDAGATADGEVTPHHPLDSIGDIVAHHQPDEVVVMVRHHHLNEVTRGDLAAKIQRHFDVPTVRVKAH